LTQTFAVNEIPVQDPNIFDKYLSFTTSSTTPELEDGKIVIIGVLIDKMMIAEGIMGQDD